jgi:glycerol-3-phosphate acyltransferase PlsX
MLDLGANVDCSADHLYQFATMGSVLAQVIDNVDKPTVGLLNIGEEEIKGNAQVKEAAELLAGGDLNYIGFVEGDDIFTDRADVVVCDGFVGNVALKTTEGVARLVSRFLKAEFSRSPVNKLIGLLAMPILKAFAKRTDPRRYNGASLLGLKGVVVKSHGSADAIAFANAINIALIEIANDVPAMIAQHMSRELSDIA